MRLSNKLAKLIFAGAAILLLSIACLLYFQIDDLVKTSRQVNRTNFVKFKLERILSNLTNAETAQRSFLLTKDSVFLEPYLQAHQTNQQLISELDNLFDKNDQQKNLNILASYIYVRFESFDHIIEQYNHPKVNTTARKYLLLKSRESMDQIREHVGNMVIMEEALLKDRQTQEARHRMLTPFYAFLLILTALIILIFSYAKIIEELNKSKKYLQELKVLNSELKKKNTALELYNKELDSFAYIASHDLREPLRKVQIFSTVIQSEEGEQLSEKSRYNMHRIQRSVKRMQKLLNDLVHYSHYTQQDQALFEPVSISSIISEVEENLKETIEDNHVVIEKKHLPQIQGMPFQLRQLFENLITNSIKFRKVNETPVISIEARFIQREQIEEEIPAHAGSYYKITYRDNGIGFNPSYSEKVFGLFQRLHTTEKYQGTGIGLTICKKIVQNHEGFMKAYSEENKGTQFEIYFPA